MLDLCHDSAKFIRAWLYSRCSIGCLNAVEPGTKVEIHRHPTKDESFVLLRGRVNIYNDDGTVLESVALCPEEGLYGVDIPKNVWHNVECLESGSVFFECKEGPFVPHEEDGILELPESRNQ